MPSETQPSSMQRKALALHGVVIFVSQQLAPTKMALHQQCTALGGKFVWAFDVPFTHYICQGKLSKRGKEYKKVEEYRAICVHPAWLKACETFGQRVAEKLYASTYNPNRSLTFVSAGDDDDDDDDDNEDEENHIPSLTISKPVIPAKPLHALRRLPAINKKSKLASISTPAVPASETPSVQVMQASSQVSNEAETIISDLESSLAQFLNNSTSSSLPRSSLAEHEHNRKSHPVIRTTSHISHEHVESDIEPSMRVEWLDDAMQAERKKMIDEDENGGSSQQQLRAVGESKVARKRPLGDSNFEQSNEMKRCRT